MVVGTPPLWADNLPTTSSFTLDNNLTQMSLGPHLAYYEDEEKKLPFDAIIEQFNQKQFTPLNAEVANLGQFRGFIWFYSSFTTAADLNVNLTWVVKLGNPWSELFDLYLRKNGGAWELYRLNSNIPYAERAVDDLHFIHPLKLEADAQYEMFIQSYVAGPAIYPITLMEKVHGLEETARWNYYLGAYYGLMGVMILYNLFLFWGTRSVAYLHYVSYLVSVLLFILFYDGLGTWLFLPNNPEKGHIALHFFAASTSVAGCAFCRSFLMTAERLPRIDKALYWSIWVGVAMCIAVFVLSIETTAMLLNLTTLTFSVLIITGGVANLRNGYKDTRFFLLGWLIFVSGASVIALTFLGLLPWNDFTRHSVQIGSTVEAVLLSLALADRVALYREQMHTIEQTAKEQLQRQNEDLIRSHALKDEFLATISHELRTPMNGIIGSLELIKIGKTIEDVQEYIETADRSSDQMMRLVGDVLELSDLQSGNAKPHNQVFSLRKQLHESFQRLAEQGREKGLSMVFHCVVDDSVYIRGDWNKLQMIFTHLLDNAIKFTEQGEVEVVVELVTSELKIVVKDSGIGIDSSIQTNIFENFQQGDGKSNRQFQGLGIGLPLCALALEVLDGKISFSSESGIGSEFTVNCPVAVANQNELSGCLFDRMGQTEPNVLVVEDNRVNQKVLVGILEKLGCVVTTADNGDEAVTCCSQQKFDLIFMDCQMPKVDGYEATRRIRQSNRLNSQTPVVAVTANVMTQDRLNCFQAGMNDFVKKPIRLGDIEKAMTRHMGET